MVENDFKSPFPTQKKPAREISRSFQPHLSPLDKKKTSNQIFSISEVIICSELSGKIDTKTWLNQAKIATPEFRRHAGDAKTIVISENYPMVSLADSGANWQFLKDSCVKKNLQETFESVMA